MLRQKFVELLKLNPIFTEANGQELRFLEYLDHAISAFELKPGDYFSAFYVLNCVAGGKGGKEVVGRIQSFWSEMEAGNDNN